MNWDEAISRGSVYWLLLVIVFLLMYIAFVKKGDEKSSKRKEVK